MCGHGHEVGGSFVVSRALASDVMGRRGYHNKRGRRSTFDTIIACGDGFGELNRLNGKVSGVTHQRSPQNGWNVVLGQGAGTCNSIVCVFRLFT